MLFFSISVLNLADEKKTEEWSGAQIKPIGGANKALWDVLASYNVDLLTGVLQNYGVVFTGTNYIVSLFNVVPCGS